VRSDQQEEKIHADVPAVGADVREREKTRRRRRRRRRRRGGERRRTIRLPAINLFSLTKVSCESSCTCTFFVRYVFPVAMILVRVRNATPAPRATNFARRRVGR
jgi:hypothetical protein